MAGHELLLALRISLLDVEPEVWRRFLVPYDITLSSLHEILQGVMGWHNQHLFEFHMDHGCFGIRHPQFQDPENRVRSAGSIILKNVISPQTKRFEYVYDLGDNWTHEIVLEEVLSNDTGEPILQCVSGANQCPPEDIGGPPGYEEFIAAIVDPSHEEHGYYVDVYGDEFDPGYFDIDEINGRLRETKRKLLRSRKNARGKGRN